MIQHHLIYYYTSLDDGITYYEANTQSAYYLVRSGKILQLIETRLGEYAARVMSAILFLGHASVSHLETLPELRFERRFPNGVEHDEEDVQENEEKDKPNGHHAVHGRLHPTLKALASHGYIIRVREAHFQSPADNWLDAERTIASRPDIKSLKGKQYKEKLLEKTMALVKERMDGDLTHGLMFQGVPRGIKRKFGNSASNTPNKRARMDHGRVNGEDADDDEENEWSEDEEGFDTISMEVSLHDSVLPAKR